MVHGTLCLIQLTNKPNKMKPKSNPITTTKYHKTRKGNFTQFLRLFSAERREYLANEGQGKLVKFDYQLALTFITEHEVYVLDTSTVTKSSLNNRVLSSHCSSYENFLHNLFSYGVMHEQFLKMADAIMHDSYTVELWADATPLVCEYGQNPSELGELLSHYRISAPVAEFRFSQEFITQLANKL